MIIAAMMPTISLISESSVDRVLPIEPAAAVVIPTSWAGPVASRTSCAISVVRSPELMSRSTGANAVCPSSESRPAVWPALLSGLVTL